MKTITKGECCVFPFQYKNKQYNNCITIDNKNTLWCATTSNFDIDGKWGNCNGGKRSWVRLVDVISETFIWRENLDSRAKEVKNIQNPFNVDKTKWKTN